MSIKKVLLEDYCYCCHSLSHSKMNIRLLGAILAMQLSSQLEYTVHVEAHRCVRASSILNNPSKKKQKGKARARRRRCE